MNALYLSKSTPSSFLPQNSFSTRTLSGYVISICTFSAKENFLFWKIRTPLLVTWVLCSLAPETLRHWGFIFPAPCLDQDSSTYMKITAAFMAKKNDFPKTAGTISATSSSSVPCYHNVYLQAQNFWSLASSATGVGLSFRQEALEPLWLLPEHAPWRGSSVFLFRTVDSTETYVYSTVNNSTSWFGTLVFLWQ